MQNEFFVVRKKQNENFKKL